MTDEAERKVAIEKRFNIELHKTNEIDVTRYRVHVDGVQKWFRGFPPALTLDMVEELMLWLDENFGGWRK